MAIDVELEGTELPEVRTEVPGPKSRALAERLRTSESPAASGIAAGDSPVFWDQTRGAVIVDVDGNRYVDLTAGFTVAVAGHSNPRIVGAIAAQAGKMLHAQGVANPNELRVRLNERLGQLAPGELSVVHLVSTGGEAIELALLTARMATGRQNVIAFQGGFHGKVGSALASTSVNYYREPFAGVLPYVYHAPFPDPYRSPFPHAQGDVSEICADYLERLLSFPDSGVTSVAAVILEPIQGHGGWVIPPVGFLRRVREICSHYGVLMVVDEIITGFGRTGAWFASLHEDVAPDILVCGKGMASGYPIAAVVTTPRIASAWKANMRSSTFLGNPVGCAASLACIEEIEEKGLVERSRVEGAYFLSKLAALQERHPLVGDVRGKGMMVGLELVKDRQTKEPAPAATAKLVSALLRRGIMATNSGGAHGNVVKLSPPLVITREQLDYAVQAFDETLSEVEAG